MRILFVTSESPIFPGGGIATYLSYMVPALKELGHELFLFTFRNANDYIHPSSFEPFDQEKVHIELVDDQPIHSKFPSPSHFQSQSHFLSRKLWDLVHDWEIDIIESTDYQAPCLALFQSIQTKRGSENRVCSTFHHGLNEVLFEADQICYPQWAIANNLAERQQMRVSDLIVAPSKASRNRLQSLGIRANMKVVREPYAVCEAKRSALKVKDEMQYVGRLSIQKGIDRIVYAANILHTVMPLRRIELIGRVGFTPFRQPDIIDFVRNRLDPELRDRLIYSDFKPRDAVLNLLRPGSLSPHLGTDETFSYACIEAINAGQVPIVRKGTAMAEFFPEDMQKFLLDERMHSVRSLQTSFEGILGNARLLVDRILDHCRRTLKPSAVAEELSSTYAEALDRKRGWKAYASSKSDARITDITVLIPAYKPTLEFTETIDSLAVQSAGMPKVLICDDGTPDSHQPWFEYARARIPECTVIRQPNAGLLAARNLLIEECRTPLSIFLDADDLLVPEALERMLEAWNNCPFEPDAVIPQRRNFGETNEPVIRHLLGDYLHLLENDYRMTALIRTEILSKIGFDATRRNGEADDWAFWLEFQGRGCRGVMIPEMGFLYRFRRGSMSWPWSEGQRVGTQTMVREAIERMCTANPERVHDLARAIFSNAVRR